MAVSVYAGFYNALDNGVVGNGTTDDAPAIQALINAVTTAGGGTLYVPPNHTYLLGSTLSLASNQTYLGAGDTSVWLAQLLGGRVLNSLLYNVHPDDLATYGAVCIALLFVAALASWVPARRAAVIDPVIAMRPE